MRDEIEALLASAKHRSVLRTALRDYQADWTANKANEPVVSQGQIDAAQDLLDALFPQPGDAPIFDASAVPSSETSEGIARRIRDNWRRGFKGSLQFEIHVPELDGWIRPDNPFPFEAGGALADRSFQTRPVQGEGTSDA